MVTLEKKAEQVRFDVPRKIETGRLLLRPWKKNKADAKGLFALAKDPRVGPSAGWPVHRDPAHSLQLIREVLSTPDIYAVLLKEQCAGTQEETLWEKAPGNVSEIDFLGEKLPEENLPGKNCADKNSRGESRSSRADRIIGAAGLTYGSTGRRWMGEREAEIGYWIGVPFWGRGYAPEAVRALLYRAFEVMGMETVWGGYYEGNEKSRRVLEKCGFVYDHTDTHAFVEALREERVEHFMKLEKSRYKG